MDPGGMDSFEELVKASMSNLDALDLALLNDQLGLGNPLSSSAFPSAEALQLLSLEQQRQHHHHHHPQHPHHGWIPHFSQPSPWQGNPLLSAQTAYAHAQLSALHPMQIANDPALIADLAMRLQQLQLQQGFLNQATPMLPFHTHAGAGGGHRGGGGAGQARDRDRIRRSTAPNVADLFGVPLPRAPGWSPHSLDSPGAPTPALPAHMRPASMPGPQPTPRSRLNSGSGPNSGPLLAFPGALAAAPGHQVQLRKARRPLDAALPAPSLLQTAVGAASAAAAARDDDLSEGSEEDDASGDEAGVGGAAEEPRDEGGRRRRRRRRRRHKQPVRLPPDQDPEFCDWEWDAEDEAAAAAALPEEFQRVMIDEYCWYPLFTSPDAASRLGSALYNPATAAAAADASSPTPPEDSSFPHSIPEGAREGHESASPPGSAPQSPASGEGSPSPAAAAAAAE